MTPIARHSPCKLFPHVLLIAASSMPVLWSIGSPASAQEARTNRVSIEYVEPQDKRLMPLYEIVKERRALEIVQEVFSPFRLPNQLTIKMTECGMSNAWYQRPTLTICYEYLEDIQKSLPKEDPPAGLTRNDLIMGQYYYVVFHELGHAVFDQLNVPLFGRPEDAADGFSAYLMLKLGKQDARRLIGGAAYSYNNYINIPRVTVAMKAFADVHGAPVQRFYNMLCLAYGADKEMFSDLVEKGYLPSERARGCRVEYGELNFAFQQLIRPHLDPELVKAVLAKDWIPEQNAPPAERASDMARKE